MNRWKDIGKIRYFLSDVRDSSNFIFSNKNWTSSFCFDNVVNCLSLFVEICFVSRPKCKIATP